MALMDIDDMAEVIRTALDEYLADDIDPSAALASTFGADPDVSVPSRDEWDLASVLVDTDVFVDHLRGAAELTPGRHRLHYSVVTRAELFAVCSGTDVAAQLLGRLREVVVDRAIAERAGRVRRETAIRLADALIAATALERKLELASRNTRDFERVRGLRLRQLS